MSPAKIAMAVAVTIAPTAAIGGRKKVIGTSSAVAIVAVRPGTAPTKRPNIAEPMIVMITVGSITSLKASSHASIVVYQANGCSRPQGSGTERSL